jgi:DNA-binding NtrC family response regulator
VPLVRQRRRLVPGQRVAVRRRSRLLATLAAQLELRRALRTVNRLDAEAARTRAAELPVIVARSRAMQHVMALVERVAPSSASILITGEHGTGKEVLARTR